MKEEGYSYEEFHAKALEICLDYGLEHTERLDIWLDGITPNLKDWLSERESEFRHEKDWLELADILTHERKLVLQSAKGNVQFPIKSSIQKEMLERMFNDRLSDSELKQRKRIVNFNLRIIKTLKGRGKSIPYAGILAWFLILTSKDWMDEEGVIYNKTQLLCLLGDLILHAGVSPVPEKEWIDFSNKDKADAVKSWIRSYQKELAKYALNEGMLFVEQLQSFQQKFTEIIGKGEKNSTQADWEELDEYLEEMTQLEDLLFYSGFIYGFRKKPNKMPKN